MAFDDKSWPIFPTRTGGAIGHAAERQMLDAIGGEGGFRTRIMRNPDGSTTMLRTKNGMPQFETIPAKTPIAEAIQDYLYARNITATFPTTPFDPTAAWTTYPLGECDNIVDIYGRYPSGKLAKASSVRVTDGRPCVFSMFGTEYPNLSAYVVDGTAYVGNSRHGAVTQLAGQIYVNGSAISAPHDFNMPPNTHLIRLNETPVSVAVSDGVLKNTAVVSECATPYEYIYDWENNTRVRIAYECADKTRYLITWDITNNTYDDSYEAFEYGIKIYATLSAPATNNGETPTHTIHDGVILGAAMAFSSTRCVYVQPSPNHKRLCIELMFSEFSPFNFRRQPGTGITDVYEAVLTGGDRNTPPSVEIALMDSAANDYQESGDALWTEPSNRCFTKYSYSAGTITTGCGTYAPENTGFPVYLEESTLLGAAYWNANTLNVMRYKYRRDTSVVYAPVASQVIQVPQTGDNVTTAAVSASIYSPRKGSSGYSLVAVGPDKTHVALQHDVSYAIEANGAPLVELEYRHHTILATPATITIDIPVGVYWPGTSIFSVTDLSYETPEGVSLYPVVAAQDLLRTWRTSNNTIMVQYPDGYELLTPVTRYFVATFGGPAEFHETPNTPPCPLEDGNKYWACANPETGEISYTLYSTWC